MQTAIRKAEKQETKAKKDDEKQMWHNEAEQLKAEGDKLLSDIEELKQQRKADPQALLEKHKYRFETYCNEIVTHRGSDIRGEYKVKAIDRVSKTIEDIKNEGSLAEILKNQGIDYAEYQKMEDGLTVAEIQQGINAFMEKYLKDDTVFVNNGTFFSNHYFEKENISIPTYNHEIIDITQVSRTRYGNNGNTNQWTSDIPTFAKNYETTTGKKIRTFDAYTKSECIGIMASNYCNIDCSLDNKKIVENLIKETAFEKDSDYVLSFARASQMQWIPAYNTQPSFTVGAFHFNTSCYVQCGNDKRMVDVDKMFAFNKNFEVTLEGTEEPIKTWEELEAKIKALNADISQELLDKIHEKYDETRGIAEQERKEHHIPEPIKVEPVKAEPVKVEPIKEKEEPTRTYNSDKETHHYDNHYDRDEEYDEEDYEEYDDDREEYDDDYVDFDPYDFGSREEAEKELEFCYNNKIISKESYEQYKIMIAEWDYGNEKVKEEIQKDETLQKVSAYEQNKKTENIQQKQEQSFEDILLENLKKLDDKSEMAKKIFEKNIFNAKIVPNLKNIFNILYTLEKHHIKLNEIFEGEGFYQKRYNNSPIGIVIKCPENTDEKYSIALKFLDEQFDFTVGNYSEYDVVKNDIVKMDLSEVRKNSSYKVDFESSTVDSLKSRFFDAYSVGLEKDKNNNLLEKWDNMYNAVLKKINQAIINRNNTLDNYIKEEEQEGPELD
jgi:hypothetical protein